MRVLFDTNAVVYWLRGSPKFAVQLQKHVSELRKKKAVRLISVVTVQEIEAWARQGNSLEKVRAFLDSQFSTPLNFDLQCAREAARLAHLVPRRQPGSRAEQREITDRWHRDASITATANWHKLDQLVTYDAKDFEPFREHIDCEIVSIGADT